MKFLLRLPFVAALLTLVVLAVVAVTYFYRRDAVVVDGPSYEPAGPPRRASWEVALIPACPPLRAVIASEPLLEALNRRMPAGEFEPVASADYAHFEARIRSGRPAVLITNPRQALLAMDCGYAAVAALGATEDSGGVLLQLKSDRRRTPAELRGGAIGFADASALAACLMIQVALRGAGLEPGRDYAPAYVGTQSSVIENVLYGRLPAGGVAMRAWKKYGRAHPDLAARLEPLLITEPLINNAVLVRRDLPAPARAAVDDALRHVAADAAALAEDDELDLRGLRPATDADYAVVRDYLKRHGIADGKDGAR